MPVTKVFIKTRGGVYIPFYEYNVINGQTLMKYYSAHAHLFFHALLLLDVSIVGSL